MAGETRTVSGKGTGELKAKGIVLIVLLLAGLVILFFEIRKQETPPSSPTIGLDAPELALRDASGKTFTLAALKGSVVFINFWASWCPPCKEEIPSIQMLYQHFRDDGRFRMLTVLYKDEYQKAIAILRQNNYDFPVLTDTDGRTASFYGLTGVPETYIVDKKGVLREKVIGPADWASPQTIGLISDLIKE
ncbi:MAG: redoxin domain-containing protein [Thermodesulfovibrionales bacterium]